MREIIPCPAPPQEVFEFLASSGSAGLSVQTADQQTLRIVFRSGMSFLSWGEEVEATIVPAGDGCRVVLDGRSLHPFNPTADVAGRVRELSRLVTERFGVTTS